jgi:hypothetical protein
MYSFRDVTPKRRENRDECELYTSYRKTLREDFLYRCGYCNDSDKFRIRSFTIDHFVPQNPKGFTHSIQPNYYYNLVYSCRYCNSSKTNKWPSLDSTIHNDGSIGFVEPTHSDYTNMYKRDGDGKIIPNDANNLLAKHIIDELNLWLPIHQLMWKLERIVKLELETKEKLEQIQDEDLKKGMQEIHYSILKELQNIQENIFAENK